MNRPHYRARYYNPAIGRFLSEDPLWFDQGVNFYSYTVNNPASHADPLGLAASGIGGIPLRTGGLGGGTTPIGGGGAGGGGTGRTASPVIPLATAIEVNITSGVFSLAACR